MSKRIFLLCLVGLFGLSLLCYAETATNINPARHPNLAKAQVLVDQAYDRIVAAQKANEFDLGGHAAKAKGHLEQASKELKLAAVESNKNAGNESAAAAERPADQNQPTESVSEAKHPNLAKAQEYIDSAYTKILDAQKANDFDLKGHAAKAKDHLEMASKELKLAAGKAQ
jgi:hypothetical protein